MCRSKRSNSVKKSASGKYESMMPPESLLSTAATMLLPERLTASMWRGAIYPAAPISANRFIGLYLLFNLLRREIMAGGLAPSAPHLSVGRFDLGCEALCITQPRGGDS